MSRARVCVLLAIANKMLIEVMPDLWLRDDVWHVINVVDEEQPMFQTRRPSEGRQLSINVSRKGRRHRHVVSYW
jgi:hypothetical protein